MPDAWPAGIPGPRLLGMVRPKVHDPLRSKADHNWNACVCVMKLFMFALLTIAAVQLPAPAQNDEFGPPNAASKNG